MRWESTAGVHRQSAASILAPLEVLPPQPQALQSFGKRGLVADLPATRIAPPARCWSERLAGASQTARGPSTRSACGPFAPATGGCRVGTRGVCSGPRRSITGWRRWKSGETGEGALWNVALRSGPVDGQLRRASEEEVDHRESRLEFSGGRDPAKLEQRRRRHKLLSRTRFFSSGGRRPPPDLKIRLRRSS